VILERPPAHGLRHIGSMITLSFYMGSDWYDIPMEAVVDQAGRIVLPKFIRDALGLLPGTKVDISPYGAGVQVVPAGRTARLVEEDGVLVSAGDTPVDDDVLFGLIDAGRR
jgi:AbrB family looped-hinge helix DNA binding protein